MKFTHKELVDKAAIWLQKTIGCKIIAKELTTDTLSREIPDVIGWKSNCSILIECKASRKDFLKDKMKPARQEYFRGVGNYRIYFTNPGIVKPGEIPLGWSLYEAYNKTLYKGGVNLKTERIFPFLKICYRSELKILQSIIRRSNSYNPIIVDSHTFRYNKDANTN
jgi:hypothetical protein